MEIQSAGSNELSYKREIFEQKFTRARQLCYDLLDNQGNSVAQYETLKRLNELLYVCVTYSDFLKGRLGLVTNSDLKSLLDKHDQEVREIQNLKVLIQNVSNNTDGRDPSGLPTADQTITFIRNVQAGMVVRYERAKPKTQSNPIMAGTPAGGKTGSKGQTQGGQASGSTTTLTPTPSTSQQANNNQPTENQQSKQDTLSLIHI